jgi:uncharacterized protein YndB with AHSA1/START domain
MRNFLYSVEREYSVPVATLWDAWTDASKLEAWYHPTDLKNVAGLTESEAVEGGVWAVAVAVPEYGFVAYFFGKYSNLKYCESLEHTMHYSQSLEEFEARDFESESHLIKVEFENRGEKAWVKFSQFGEMPEEQIALTIQGMESYFDSLGNFLGN